MGGKRGQGGTYDVGLYEKVVMKLVFKKSQKRPRKGAGE
jgi:hypothetical protein